MKKLTLVFFCLLITLKIYALKNTLYSRAYGASTNPAVIFIHGGPRGNSTLFEGTTAQVLANRGFYVIVYDRRGEGRSIDTTAKFTFQEAIDDLNGLLNSYKIKKVNIIAHSFGGLAGTLYAEQHPEKVISLTLAGALFSQQETYDHILRTTKKIYEDKHNSLMVSKISAIENLDKNSAEYRKQCYEVAGKCDYFKMPMPTAESKKLWTAYELGDFNKVNIRNDKAPILFYENESRNNIDTKPILKKLKNLVRLYAIYGRDDKIFSVKQLNDMKSIVGGKNFSIIENCSHYPFVDKQKIFIETLTSWTK